MNLLFKYLVLLVLFLFTSCLRHTGDSEKGLVMEIKDIESNKLDVSDFVDMIEIYQLETDSFLVGEIGDLCVYDSILFAIDKLTFNLFSYNLRTKTLLSCVNKKGNGPYEYIKPQALSVDGNCLYLLDSYSQKIICYNHKLESCNEIRLSFTAFDFFKVNGGFLLCSTLPDPSLEYKKIVFTDEDGNIKNTFIHTHQYGMTVGKNFIQQSEDSVFVTIPYSNQIYRWNGNMLYGLYYTDFGHLNIPEDMRMKDLSFYDDDYIHNNNFFVTNSFFINAFPYENKMHYHIQEKVTGNSYCGIMRDEKNGLPFFPRWQYKDYLIGVCRLEELTEVSKKQIGEVEDGLAVLFFKVKEL